MKPYQQEFVDFLIQTGALKFGEFTLKSGRRSPYFFNSASFDSAVRLEKLGYFYACATMELEDSPTIVFGPAYKGIPLAVATCLALRTHFGVETGYCFDRKESKTHGDRGFLVGRAPEDSDRVVLVDDVITDGMTKVEAIKRLKSVTNTAITGLVIALNRQEKTPDGDDPVRRLEETSGVRVAAIATLDDVITALSEREKGDVGIIDEKTRQRIEAYRAEYGI